ncbi:MAG: glutamate synthase-related protein [Acidimicrobiales bacterium]
MPWWLWVVVVGGLALLGVVIYDLLQTKHAILRNFPIVGHFRYILERVGPELRQYIVTDNDEERPFSRDQRRFIYASAKGENSYFGFGTDNDIDVPNYLIIRHAAFPHSADPDGQADDVPMAKAIGEHHNRSKAFQPASVLNLSAMSYGSLSAVAVEALNRGAKIANCLHNTGEGGISDHHRHGGPLVFQIGTGYFGARKSDGRFSIDTMLASMEGADVRAIEVKLSQGAKPGLGGVLPGGKVTAEIARVRNVEIGVTVRSPNRHPEFSDVSGLIDFVEDIASATGLPVGIKSAVGEKAFWHELAEKMRTTTRGPDFISVDGGEGGTGAAPLPFSDHVALPFRDGFAEVYRAFADEGIHRDVVFLGAGRLGLPANAMTAFAMGVDGISVAREGMIAIGCIQAQKCHTSHCPTGVATHSRWLTRGLDPSDKSVRFANYIASTRHEILRLAHAMGADHPSRIDPDLVGVRADGARFVPIREMYGYDPSW